LPFIPASNIVFCGDKGIIDANYLINDERDISATFAALAFSFLRLTIWTKGSATVSQIGKRFAESF